jgi:Clr5 domain
MAMPAQPGASSASQQQPRKMTALERNRLEWETHKDEIEAIYMDRDETLEETMLYFKEKRALDWR